MLVIRKLCSPSCQKSITTVFFTTLKSQCYVFTGATVSIVVLLLSTVYLLYKTLFTPRLSALRYRIWTRSLATSCCGSSVWTPQQRTSPTYKDKVSTTSPNHVLSTTDETIMQISLSHTHVMGFSYDANTQNPGLNCRRLPGFRVPCMLMHVPTKFSKTGYGKKKMSGLNRYRLLGLYRTVSITQFKLKFWFWSVTARNDCFPSWIQNVRLGLIQNYNFFPGTAGNPLIIAGFFYPCINRYANTVLIAQDFDRLLRG